MLACYGVLLLAWHPLTDIESNAITTAPRLFASCVMGGLHRLPGLDFTTWTSTRTQLHYLNRVNKLDMFLMRFLIYRPRNISIIIVYKANAVSEIINMVNWNIGTHVRILVFLYKYLHNIFIIYINVYLNIIWMFRLTPVDVLVF